MKTRSVMDKFTDNGGMCGFGAISKSYCFPATYGVSHHRNRKSGRISNSKTDKLETGEMDENYYL